MKNAEPRAVEDILTKLHHDAKLDPIRMTKGVVKGVVRPPLPEDFETAYLPISREQGRSLRDLIIENKCQHIVEFGTSFGISTIYMADAAQQTSGKIITTELLPSKAERAAQNIRDAGLEDYVEFRVGDAMNTLNSYSHPIDLLFLDGWKDLYLPLFRMLEPNFHEGTLIYADNTDMEGTRRYSDYLHSKGDVYRSTSIHEGKALLTQIQA